METTKTTYKIEIWGCDLYNTSCETGLEAINEQDDNGVNLLLEEFDSLDEVIQHLNEMNYHTWCVSNKNAGYELTYNKICIVSYKDGEPDKHLKELVIGEEDLQPLVEEWEKLHPTKGIKELHQIKRNNSNSFRYVITSR